MAAKTKLDPRKMMEMAIEMMRKSISEGRPDGKKSPAVGAVLLKPDGSIETAYRGELRDGDHAEFTLLERKNRASRLDGAILFATLEPCAPGARNHPKLSCAERIVLARIKEVWVGVEDPDPAVDRKGIKYLQDNGIKVHMFDRDLQSIIEKENKAFIAQAVERAAAEKKKLKTTPLSSFENQISTASMKDFSLDWLGKYRKATKISDPIDSEAFRQRLMHQGILRLAGKKLVPTGYGVLLFGKTPRDMMPQAGLLGTIHYPNGKDETRDFEGPLVSVPSELEKWLKDKLPNTIDRSQMVRRQSVDLPFEMIREAVVNALVHRNYEITGAKCQLIISENTVVVKSPGKPIDPITLEQLQSFNAPMLSRNPLLHYVFARMKMAEERGFGLESIKARASDLGLPLPKYSWVNPYLQLELYRNSAGAVESLAPQMLASLSKAERAGWQWVVTKEAVVAIEYAAMVKVPKRTALNHLKHFTELGLLVRMGSGPTTQYKVKK